MTMKGDVSNELVTKEVLERAYSLVFEEQFGNIECPHQDCGYGSYKRKPCLECMRRYYIDKAKVEVENDK